MRRVIDPAAAVRPVEDLAELAATANREHAAGEADVRAGLEHFRAAGEALLKAKKRCGHGRWLPWLKANVKFSQQTASVYMRVAQDWDKLPAAGNLRDALRLLTEVADGREEERQRREETRRRAAAAGRQAGGEEIRTGDFREVLSDLPDGCATLILTDPPYDDASVPIFTDLAVVAERLLCEGGSLVTYAGHNSLFSIGQALSERLRWWHPLCLLHRGPHARLDGKRVNVGWKPVLWFVKGYRLGREFVFDVLPSNIPDKQLHDWQQGDVEAEYLISHLTEPGDLVVDPMCGSGTVPAAALRLGRRALGVELDPQRADVARFRVREAAGQ
jgi:hypothetical protein